MIKRSTMLKLGALAGILCLGGLLYPLAVMGAAVLSGGALEYTPSLAVMLTGLFSYLLYLNGLAHIGMRYKNIPLTYASLSLGALSVVATLAMFVPTPATAGASNALDFLILIANLGISIAMLTIGWKMLDLKSKLGSIAVWYGSLELLTALGVTLLYPQSTILVNAVLYALGSVMMYRLSLLKR